MRDARALPMQTAWRAALVVALLFAWLARPAPADTLAEEIGRAETRFAAALGGDWQALEELLGDPPPPASRPNASRVCRCCSEKPSR